MLKSIENLWSSSVLIKTWKQECSCRYYFIPLELKKNDASILPKAGCCYSVLTNFDFEWNKAKSANQPTFLPRLSVCNWQSKSNWDKSMMPIQWKFNKGLCSEKPTEPFLSTLQNMGVKFLQGVENFQQGEVLFVQAAYKFLHAAKMHFMQLYLEFCVGICTKYFKKCQLWRILDQICKHQ